MEVRATKTEYIKVDVDPIDVIEHLRGQWLSWQPGEVICDKVWQRQYRTSHSWYENTRHATDEEIQIYEAFDLIMKVAKSLEEK